MTLKNGLPAIHPGEFLREVLEESGTSQAELALLFGRAFGQSPQYWLNLQATHDLKTAEKTIGSRVLAVRPLAQGGITW
jgi:antitoxin HigA-1